MIEQDKMYQSIKLSLMKKDTDLNNENKAEYIKYATATFKVPEDFYYEDHLNSEIKYGTDYMKALLNSMFEDLEAKSPPEVDSLGIWIDMNDHTIENAISLQTLKDIKEYSGEDVDSLYEFFKMTLSE